MPVRTLCALFLFLHRKFWRDLTMESGDRRVDKRVEVIARSYLTSYWLRRK